MPEEQVDGLHITLGDMDRGRLGAAGAESRPHGPGRQPDPEQERDGEQSSFHILAVAAHRPPNAHSVSRTSREPSATSLSEDAARK